MTPDEAPRRSTGRIVLLLSAAIALIAIAVSVQRSRQGGALPDSASTAAAASAADPLAALETRTRDNPDDGEAWSALASGYFETGRFDEAVTAYDPALKLAPQRASLWSARGEARVMASRRDPMPAAAVADFERAIKLDAKDPRARYFLAVRQDLTGDHQGAIDSWLALLADTPPGAVWEADLRRTIEQAGKINQIAVAPGLAKVRQPAPPMPKGITGPSADDLRGASAIPPREQRKMAEDMVARLETRLRGDPSNLDGWVMLIRSRMTLGQPDAARAALDAAVKANPGQAARLREQAASLGVP